MEPTVAVLGTLRFPPDKVADLRPHLRKLVETTHLNDGCIAYDIAEDPFDPGLIRFSELWPDRESLARHLKAPHVIPWREVAHSLGLVERKFKAYDISGSWEL